LLAELHMTLDIAGGDGLKLIAIKNILITSLAVGQAQILTSSEN